MILINEQSNKIIEIIKGHAMKNFEEVQEFVAEVKRIKPENYDSHVCKIRDYYKGNQEGYVNELLKKHFEETAEDMTPQVFNIIKSGADFDANAYRQTPDRRIVGNEKDNDIFDEVLKVWRVDSVLQEMERRLMACKTMFLRLNWPSSLANELGVKSEPQITIFYPDMIHVISDERDIDNIQAAKVIVADISNKTTKKYEVWERIGREIYFSVFTEDKLTEKTKWDGDIMPWVVYHDGLSQDSMYLDIDRDIITTQDSINLELSDRNWRVRYNSHKAVVQHGGSPKATKISAGPSFINVVGHETKFTVLDTAVDDSTLDEIQTIIKMQGIARRQSPDNWSTARSTPLSGISREIANIGANEKRKERIDQYKRIEERYLLPLIIDISNKYSDFDEILNPVFEVKFHPPKIYEDPVSIVNKLAVEQDKGWISPARAAVENGRYRNIDEAVEAGVSNEIKMVENKATGTIGVM